MRNLITNLLSIFFFTTSLLSGQEVAVTERGDSVVLYSNGTWDYYENYLTGFDNVEEIRINPEVFAIPKASGKKVNGLNQTYELWYDEQKWKRIPAGELNPDADIALKYLHGDLYAMIIYEEVEISVENLVEIALDNAIGVAPDIRAVDKEYRVVNDNTLIWMRMDGTTQGMKMSYYSYYYSNVKGTWQFHVFSGTLLIDRYIEDVEDLLNGFQVRE